jgi:acetylornithine deacetylase/succinyl-diaminopimelate desuccinylase-like protein
MEQHDLDRAAVGWLKHVARSHARSVDLVDLGGIVLGTDSRSGREEMLARRLADWGRATTGASASQWSLQALGPHRANLLGWTGSPSWAANRGLWFYGHLDTSLTGDPALDLPLTGHTRPSTPAAVDRYGLTGVGVAVSKGPALCALVAYQALARAAAQLGLPLQLGLLLAGGGTHRAPSGGFGPARDDGLDQGFGLGVEAALAEGLRPSAVINVKGGAAGVLSAEPGCLILRIEVRSSAVALPGRSGHPGAAVLAAVVAQEVEAWRSRYVWSHLDPTGQVAVDACVGAVEAGLPFKPDFVPGAANVYAYVVTLPGADTEALVDELTAAVRGRLRELPDGWATPELDVVVVGRHGGQATPESAPIVRAARAAFESTGGPGSSKVLGYRGSTDGVIFRRTGIDTVRVGPTAMATAEDPTVERLSTAELLRFIDLYIDAAGHYLTTGHSDPAPSKEPDVVTLA